MSCLNLVFSVTFLLCCSAELSDYMQQYEQQCLGEDKMHCSDGSCIWQHQYCDGKIDCPDGSDENLCADHTPEPHLCTDTHYLCKDGSKCIPNTWVCNNQTDCADGSDEENCTTIVKPATNSSCPGYECKSDGLCLSKLWVCDHRFDCADHSDEEIETCRTSGVLKFAGYWDVCPIDQSSLFGTKMYQCFDSSFCAPGKFMCDGRPDCRDGSDEGLFCENWSTMCANKTCRGNSTCYPERFGPICLCPDVYHRYNESSGSCAPVNMCAEPRPYCGQKCTDRGGPFLCACAPGYHASDHTGIAHTCLAPDPEPMLFFTTRNEVKYLSVRSRNITTVATGIKQAHSVACDGSHVYWVETEQGHQAIMAAPLDGTSESTQVIVGLGVEDPGDIAIDYVGKNLYYSDALRGAIMVCPLDGGLGPCLTLNTDARVPKHLALDVANGQMYWADWHDAPVIMTARMDGSHSRALVRGLKGYPIGLALDVPNQRMYYVDGHIKGVRLDDGRVFSLADHVPDYHKPYAVSVFEGIVYWSDWATNTIRGWDKLGARDRGTFATLDSPVYDLHMYHPLLTSSGQQRLPACSHLRLLTSDQTAVCACPDGMRLDDSNMHCKPLEGYRPQYVVVGSLSRFTLLQYNAVGTHSEPVRLDIGSVQAMAYDTRRDKLYIYDSRWKTINSIEMTKFKRGSTDILIIMGLDNVVDMDYDYVTDALYFADAGRKFVEVVSLSTGKRAVIHHFDHETPISLCVLPNYGTMLVAVSESEQNNVIHIDSLGLDGSSRRHLLVTNLRGPHVRLRYSRKMDNVYFADEGSSLIDHVHPQGTGRETFRWVSTSVAQLALTDTLVLWTPRVGARLYWADIHTVHTDTRRLPLPMFENTTHLHIQATWSPVEVPPHACQHDVCSDVCVQTPREDDTHSPTDVSGPPKPSYKCLCPAGLVAVGGACEERASCRDEEAYCHRSNRCVMRAQLCDGRADCAHGEDEEGCPATTASNATCTPDRKLCEGVCVDKNTVCISTTTTPAVSTSTEAEQWCRPTQFDCVAGELCVERSQLCDGVADCPNNADEASALCDTLTCLHTEFMCTSGQCVLSGFRCDGEIDCNDGSDEFNCSTKTCEKGFFQCRNLQCIDALRRCDAQQDCTDFSDEDNCENPDQFASPEPENCAEWEHTCELNRSICVPLNARCNGKSDCPGGTDEMDCGNACLGGGVRCPGARPGEVWCIPRVKLCDGHADCADGADETKDSCDRVNQTWVPRGVQSAFEYARVQCHEGFRCGSGQCIEWRAVCDSQTDCADASDEGPRCLSACENNTCSFTCQRTPSGPLCQCPAGYLLGPDHATCQDVDECQQDLCSQHCYNTPGSFICGCHRGYALRSDRRSCKADKGNMSVLYVSGNSVRSITADGQISLEYNERGLPWINDMDYDVRRQLMYTTLTEAGILMEVNNTQEKITVKNIGLPSTLAVDWISGNVYFVDRTPEDRRMRVCNVARKRCAKLQKLPLHAEVSALALDPASHKIFYCATAEGESVVWWSSFSGRHVAQVAAAGNCTGLAADSYRKRLYLAQTGPAKILTMDYQGNVINELAPEGQEELEAPHHLALFEDHVYFLVANSLKLSRCVLYGRAGRGRGGRGGRGGRCEPYLQRVFDAHTFVIRHESVQRDDLPDYCAGASCDNVCVPGDLEAVCLCDDGAVSKDGRCPTPDDKDVPLFNGLAFRVASAGAGAGVGGTVVPVLIGLVTLSVIVASFLYYVFVYKKRPQDDQNYVPVHFHNTMAEGTSQQSGEVTPETTPTVQMPPLGASAREFVNPLQNPVQVFRDWTRSLKKTRPIGTAGLEINVPPLDVSDTESDLDDRESKTIVKK